MEPTLDRIDFAILSALQKDARITNKELAARVGLAPSSTHERVRKLEDRGVIRGAHAALDAEALGLGVQALMAVRLTQHDRALVEDFREHALSRPEVVSVFHLTGENDFLLHVAVRDVEHLRTLAMEAFTTRDEVAHLQTSLVYEYSRKPFPPLLEG